MYFSPEKAVSVSKRIKTRFYSITGTLRILNIISNFGPPDTMKCTVWTYTFLWENIWSWHAGISTPLIPLEYAVGGARFSYAHADFHSTESWCDQNCYTLVSALCPYPWGAVVLLGVKSWVPDVFCAWAPYILYTLNWYFNLTYSNSHPDEATAKHVDD